MTAMKDAHNGPPNEMQRKHNDLDAGQQAFADALKPQEGQFARGATWIMNKPKDLSDKPSRNPNEERTRNPTVNIALALVERNASGQFQSIAKRPDVKE